jgi:hypothetical protein
MLDLLVADITPAWELLMTHLWPGPLHPGATRARRDSVRPLGQQSGWHWCALIEPAARDELVRLLGHPLTELVPIRPANPAALRSCEAKEILHEKISVYVDGGALHSANGLHRRRN